MYNDVGSAIIVAYYQQTPEEMIEHHYFNIMTKKILIMKQEINLNTYTQ